LALSEAKSMPVTLGFEEGVTFLNQAPLDSRESPTMEPESNPKQTTMVEVEEADSLTTSILQQCQYDS
jgi:hypothetical protein